MKRVHEEADILTYLKDEHLRDYAFCLNVAVDDEIARQLSEGIAQDAFL